MSKFWQRFLQSKWSIHNPLKNWTFHGLCKNQIQVLLSSLTDAERKFCYVWKKEWPYWRRLLDSELNQLSPYSAIAPAHLPALPSNILTHEEEITSVHSISNEPKHDLSHRRHKRFEVKVPVEIILKDQVFKTETTDVSESGLRFKDSLPDWLAGYFTVILKLEGKKVEVVCMLVEDQKNEKNRAEVVDTKDEESGLHAYMDWVRQLGPSAAGA